MTISPGLSVSNDTAAPSVLYALVIEITVFTDPFIESSSYAVAYTVACGSYAVSVMYTAVLALLIRSTLD